MNRFSNEIKVGLTILVALIVAFVGFRLLQDIPLFGESFHLHSYYERADGISPGSTIYLAGVKVGSVRRVNFEGDSIRVDMNFTSIDGIPRNSVAAIEAMDLLGSRAIVVRSSGEDEYIEDGGYIRGEFDEGIAGQFSHYGDELMPRVSESTEKLGQVLSEFDKLMKEGGRENIAGMLSNLNSTTRNVDRLIAEKNQELAESVERFNNILANVDTLSRGRHQQLDTVLVNLEETSREMNRLSRELNVLSDGLNESVDKLNSGEGSLGKMLNDPSLYNNLDSLARGLNTTVEKLNEDPRHFLQHMRLFDMF